jgi:hypothetical protein
MRLVEVEPTPVESYALKPGIAWYAGTQAGDNDISEPPPVEYLCSVAAGVAERAWYGARIGNLSAEGREITVLYFVDPETRRIYAQPHPDTGAATQREWGVSDPYAGLPFELARETARWIFKVSKGRTKDHEAWWLRYMAGSEPGGPPIPFGLAANPDHVYRDQGWIGFTDWLVPPRLSRKPNTGKPKRGASDSR